MRAAINEGGDALVGLTKQHQRLTEQAASQRLLANEMMDLVDHGIDLAVRFGELSDSRLVVTRLGALARYLCAAASYLAAHGVPASLDELAKHDCVCGMGDSWPFLRDGRPYLHWPEEEVMWGVYPHRRHVPLKVKLAVEHLQTEFQNRQPVRSAPQA